MWKKRKQKQTNKGVMKKRISTVSAIAVLVCGVALSALASTNCQVVSSLGCYGTQSTCTYAGQKGTPSNSSGTWSQCVSGCPGGTTCKTTTSQTCTYTCTVNGVDHQSQGAVAPAASGQPTGACPPVGVNCS